MEAFQREHIYSHLDELICNTNLDSLFIAYLVSKNILSGSDVAELDSIKNQLDKSRKFYEIIVTKNGSYNYICEALQHSKKTGALKILQHIEGFGPSSSTYEPDLPEISGRIRKRVRYDVRSPVQLFTGREEELLILCEQLQSNTPQMTLVTQITSITGLGGIGKSELCRKYLQMYSGNHDGNCIWIDAEKPENMKNGFKILAKDHLKISLKDVDGEDKSIETVVDEVYNFFRDKKSIFVFDNAISSDCKHLDKFLPLRVFDAAPRIIITSRDKEWDLPVRVLPLKELKEWDAVEFVKKSLCIENNSQDKMILRLVNVLQKFPLALTQAVAYIKQQQMIRKFDISNYLLSYEKNAEKLLSANLPMRGIAFNNYAHTTFTTWKTTTEIIYVDKEGGPLAMCLLNAIAYLAPDKISVVILSKLSKTGEEDLYSALQLLVRYSMISSQITENSFSVHRLVQHVTRIELKQNNMELPTLKECYRILHPIPNYSAMNHAKYLYLYLQDHESLHEEFSELAKDMKRQIVPNVDLTPELLSRIGVSFNHQTGETGHSMTLTLTGLKVTGLSFEDGRLFTESLEIADPSEENSESD